MQVRYPPQLQDEGLYKWLVQLTEELRFPQALEVSNLQAFGPTTIHNLKWGNLGGWEITENTIRRGSIVLDAANSRIAVGTVLLDSGGIKLYDGANQRGLLSIDGSGWLGDSSKFLWNTAGVLSIDGAQIQASTIVAGALNVSQLSAIAADLGSITAGTITGGTLQTAASGARVVANVDGIKWYDATTQRGQILNDGSGWLGDSSKFSWTAAGVLTNVATEEEPGAAAPIVYFPDASESDQGATNGTAFTVKYLIDTVIGATKNATIIFSHPPEAAGDTTTYTFSTTETIPSNIAVKIEKGAILAVDNGVTLTIERPVEAGSYQCFSLTGTGKVVLNQHKVNVVWYTTAGDGSSGSKWANGLRNAFECNKSNTHYYCPRGEYEDTSTIDLDDDDATGYWTVQGDGVGVTKFNYAQTDDTSLLKVQANTASSDLIFVLIQGISFHGGGTAHGAGLEMVRISRCRVENCSFWGFDADTTNSKGIWIKGHEMSDFTNVRMYECLKGFHIDDNPGSATIALDSCAFDKIYINPNDQDNGYGWYIAGSSDDLRLFNIKFGPNVNVVKSRYAIYWESPSSTATCVGISVDDMRVEQGDSTNKDCWAIRINYGSVIERINLKNLRVGSTLNGIDIGDDYYCLNLDCCIFAAAAGYTAYDIDGRTTLFMGVLTQTAATKTLASGIIQLHGDQTADPAFALYSNTATDYHIPEKILFNDEIVHQYAKSSTKTANYTCTVSDSGKILYANADAITFTLPATVLGYTYTFVNKAADGTVGFNVSPDAADKIRGAGNAGADNKDRINTKATAVKGDLMTIIGDGDLGWYVTAMNGTWDVEA